MTDEERIAYADEYARASLAVALSEEMERIGVTREDLARSLMECTGSLGCYGYVGGVLEADVSTTLRMAAVLADALDCDLKICLLRRKTP